MNYASNVNIQEAMTFHKPDNKSFETDFNLRSISDIQTFISEPIPLPITWRYAGLNYKDCFKSLHKLAHREFHAFCIVLIFQLWVSLNNFCTSFASVG